MGNWQAIIRGGYPDKESVILIIYDPEKNRFYDISGELIYNIFEMITPNDLRIFRNDPNTTWFYHRTITHMYVEIIEPEGEMELGWDYYAS